LRSCQDFNFLISSLTADDFKAFLLPLFESQAKKNAEVTLFTLKHFLETATLDFSPVSWGGMLSDELVLDLHPTDVERSHPIKDRDFEAILGRLHSCSGH
jgi:hypothetical protein